MKKAILLLAIALLLSGCSNNGGQPSMEIPRISQPRYPQVEVCTVDEFLDWIRIVDAETFQDGEYRQVVPALRNSGKVLFPTFEDSNMELFNITILRDTNLLDGIAGLVYVFFVENERVVVSTRELREEHAANVDRDLHSHIIMMYGERWRGATQGEAPIQIITGTDIRIENISYLIVSDLEDTGRPMTSITFVVDGFGVFIQQDRDLFRDDILSNLRLEVVTIG